MAVDDTPTVPPENDEDGETVDSEVEQTILDDEITDKAVDDITATEGDEIPEEEEESGESPEEIDAGQGHFWSTTWLVVTLPFTTSIGRWMTFWLFVIGVTTVGWIPSSRYWILNTAGVRASSSITVVDAATQLPLPNVTVTLAGRAARTTDNGTVRLTALRLGPENVTISRPGFAALHQRVTIGWGDNPLNSFALNATGSELTIHVRDYASGKALNGALATSGAASALSDQGGTISLVLGGLTDTSVPVTVTLDGYMTTTVTVSTNGKPTSVDLVPTRPVIYVAQHNGAYDLYKSNVDGSDPVVLLPGSGYENGSAIAMASSSDGAYAALVSIRDNQQDAAGSSFDTLTLVAVGSGIATVLAHAEQIHLLGWVGPSLIFEQVTTTGGVQNYSIVSYDYTTNSRVQLVSAQKVPVALVARGMVYYAVATSATGPQAGFYVTAADGGGRKQLYNQEVLGVLRTDYATLALQTESGWLSFDLATGASTTVGGPNGDINRQYIDSGDGTESAWLNQGTLLNHAIAANKDTVISAQTGITYPIYWYSSDAVVYRVTIGSQSADYIGSTAGGVTHKIADVTDTSGFTIGQ